MVAVDEKRDVEAEPASAVPHFTPSERAARGRSARAECPRSSHADFEIAEDRDPVAILEAQATPASRSSSPSATDACWSPRSPSTAVRRR
jgi:hypothetical protein